VEDIQRGAATVTLPPTAYTAGVTADSISHFGIALSPLRALVRRDDTSDQQIVETLSIITHTLSKVLTSGAIEQDDEDSRLALRFFQLLAESILSSISKVVSPHTLPN
jgi:hypothetical protein